LVFDPCDPKGLKNLAMSQGLEKFLMFRNRLEKVYRHLTRLAKKQNVTCYRIYDHDIPEFPLLVEIYETNLYVAEYKRNHSLDETAHDEWWQQCREILSSVTGVNVNDIFLKSRQRKENRQGQYQKLDEKKNEFIVKENDLSFIINLSDYLDTGLFLDHRITRKMVQDMVKGKDFLNLFCYTGSFSVYALAGGANLVESVDLSKTYLEWTSRNVELNFPGTEKHKPVHADVKQYLKNKNEKFHVIVMDPPTFSNSKRMDDFLDIQRDHVDLVNDCMNLLHAGGILFFSTNLSKFKLDEKNIKASSIKDITKATTPFDFAGKLNRFCFRITK
jgi:23S rRNA (cytosine1962-C5)-methyltransferase